MPIRCLNSGCGETFEDFAEYMRHRSDHAIDEGATMYRRSA